MGRDVGRGMERDRGRRRRRNPPPPASQGQIQLDSPAFGGVAAQLASPQPRARHRGGTDAAERGCSASSRSSWLDVPRGSPPAFLAGGPRRRRGNWRVFGGTPRREPKPRRRIGATSLTPDPCGAPSPLAIVIDALRDPAASVDARLAALSLCAQLASRTAGDAFPGVLASEPGAGHAMASGALAAVARIAGERAAAPAPTPPPPPSPRRFSSSPPAPSRMTTSTSTLLREYPPGVAIAKVPTFAGVINDALLSPRLALRADACDCVEVVVSARGDARSVDRLLSFDVAEHVFELLRDLTRASAMTPAADGPRTTTTRGGRHGVSVASVTRTERDAAARTALAALAALAERSHRRFNPGWLAALRPSRRPSPPPKGTGTWRPPPSGADFSSRWRVETTRGTYPGSRSRRSPRA